MDLVDKIIELTDLFDDNVVTTADKIPQPEPRQDVVDREAINRFMKDNPMADGGRINFDGGGSPLQKFRQEIVESMKPYAPDDVTEDQLQLVVKDITLDMTAEQAQASALSNFRKLFGMAGGGRIGLKDGYRPGAPIDPLDPQRKISEVMDAYDRYYKGPGKKVRKIPFRKFFEIYAKENFADGGRILFQDAGSVNKIEDDILTQIKEKFPDYDAKINKYGFPKKDPRYEKVRTMYRTLTGAFKAYEEKRKTDPERIKYKKEYTQRPEVKQRTLESQREYYKDPVKRERILARNRLFASQPEQQKKRKKYMQKRYYEGGGKEKDLARLKKRTISKNVSGYLQNTDNILLKDMIRAAEQNPDSGLKIIRGGEKNAVVAVQEGDKIYHAVGAKRKPVPGAPKNSIPITKHPAFKKRFEFVKQQKQFSNTKIPGTNTTYGKALDMLESKKAGTPLQNKNPAEFEHVKGVAADYKKGQIALRSANRGKQSVLTALKYKSITKAQADKELKKLGVRGFVDGKYIGAPKINPEKQFNDLKKYVDRSVKTGAIGLEKLDQATSSGPTLGMNLGFLKGFGEAIKAVPTPAGAVALNLGLGVDPTSAIDRASIAAEAAFAPGLVKQAAKFGPVAQRFFNLGLSPAMAARAARIASPIGLASLAAEGAYQAGKFTKKRIGELKAMSPEERAELRQKGEAFAFDPFQAAGGGIAKLAGDPSGAMLESMNPDSQGLRSLKKRVKTI